MRLDFESRRRREQAQRDTSPARAHALLRSEIRSGALPPSTQLVEDDLIRDLAASRGAVREALRRLVAEGLVTRSPRVGTMVVTQVGNVAIDQMFPLEEGRRGSGSSVEQREQRMVPAPPVMRRRLGTDSADVLHYEQLIRFHDRVAAVRRCYAPAEFLVGHVGRIPVLGGGHDTTGAQKGWEHDFDHLFGVELGGIDSTVEVLAADAATAAVLELEPGAPVLVWEAVMSGEDGRARLLAWTYYRTDINVLHVSGPARPLRATGRWAPGSTTNARPGWAGAGGTTEEVSGR